MSFKDELRELIWYELGDGLNATDVNEAIIAIINLVDKEVETKVNQKRDEMCYLAEKIGYEKGLKDGESKGRRNMQWHIRRTMQWHINNQTRNY